MTLDSLAYTIGGIVVIAGFISIFEWTFGKVYDFVTRNDKRHTPKEPLHLS